MRQFLKIRTLLNSLQHHRPRGRKVSLPEDAIAAYSLRRLSEAAEQQKHDMRKRSQSAFGEGISRFAASVTSPQSSMEELCEI
jgi:transaldolase